MTMNGHEFEHGRLWGQLLERSDQQIHLTRQVIDLQDRQLEATVRLSETITHALSVRTVPSDDKPTSGLKDLTEFVRVVAPILVLTLAVAGKTANPESLPLLREILGAVWGAK